MRAREGLSIPSCESSLCFQACVCFRFVDADDFTGQHMPKNVFSGVPQKRFRLI